MRSHSSCSLIRYLLAGAGPAQQHILSPVSYSTTGVCHTSCGLPGQIPRPANLCPGLGLANLCGWRSRTPTSILDPASQVGIDLGCCLFSLLVGVGRLSTPLQPLMLPPCVMCCSPPDTSQVRGKDTLLLIKCKNGPSAPSLHCLQLTLHHSITTHNNMITKHHK